MSTKGPDRIGSALAIALIALAVPQVLWPTVWAPALRPALIGVFLAASAYGLLRDHRSGLLRLPLPRLRQALRGGHNRALELCAAVMAVWVIVWPPD